jgi:hypothetical protein
MLCSYINGPDGYIQIYGDQIFPDPPDHSIFNGSGGGFGIPNNTHAHLYGPSLSMQIYGLYWIPDPPPPRSVLPLMEGGGPECVIKDMHRSVVKRKAHRSMAQGVFRNPPTDLPLTEGGSPEWNLSSGGPLSIHGMILLVPSPTASYCLTYLHHLLTSSSTFPKESHPIISVKTSPHSLVASPLTMIFTPNR